MPAKSSIFAIVLILFSGSIGFILVESLYRAYLYQTEPYYFQSDGGLIYFQTSPFEFNEEFGFNYVPGTPTGGAIYDGRVTGCSDSLQDWMINERGNSGRIRGTYEDAEFKILVFGDSYTQRPRKNARGEYMTWPNFLQDYLEESLDTSVHVVNFGRDSYGVLQMFDLAAAKVAEWQPDLFIIAFISDDLTRDRFWRSVTELDGSCRIMLSRVPDPNPTWEIAAEIYLLEPNATTEWCERLLASGATDDPLVKKLEAAYIDGQRRGSVYPNPFSLTHSFVLEQIIYGSPYHSIFDTHDRLTPIPRHTLQDFDWDEKLKTAVRKLDDTNVPYTIIHLAGVSEINDGVEYKGNKINGRLVRSLEKVTGKKIYGTVANIDDLEFDIEKIPTDPPKDAHPSLYGHEFYARMVLNILLNDELPARFQGD